MKKAAQLSLLSPDVGENYTTKAKSKVPLDLLVSASSRRD
jgi:hypothetical protein